jgi:DNA-binding transcriptional LysR family regulator
MELTHLRYFVNVAKTHSFVNGARLSHVTPPAISKAIKKLEGELGTALFIRTTRHAALTQAGELLLAHCRDLFRCVENLERALEQSRNEVAGELRIGAIEVFSTYLLPVALCGLTRLHPRVTPMSFEMAPALMEQRVLRGDLDLGFTVGGTGARGIEYTTLGRSPGLLVCGRSHRLYRRARITPRQAQTLPFVVPRFFELEHLPPIDQYPEEVHPRSVGATIELLQMAIQMTVSGDFLGYFPEISIRRYLEDGSLRRLVGVKPGPPFELNTLVRKCVSMKAAASLLIDEVRSLIVGS